MIYRVFWHDVFESDGEQRPFSIESDMEPPLGLKDVYNKVKEQLPLGATVDFIMGGSETYYQSSFLPPSEPEPESGDE